MREEFDFDVQSLRVFRLSQGSEMLATDGASTVVVQDETAVYRGCGLASLPSALAIMLFPEPDLLAAAHDEVARGNTIIKIDDDHGVITAGGDDRGTAVISALSRGPAESGFWGWDGREALGRLPGGTAYVSNYEDDERLFGASVELDMIGTVLYGEPGPNDVALDEALGWARARASRIVLRVHTGRTVREYSVGDQQIVSLPSWPRGA